MLLVCELMLMLDDQLFVEHADLAVSVAVDLCDLAVTCGDDEPDPDLCEFCDRCVRCDLFERCVPLPLAFAFMCLFACSICALLARAVLFCLSDHVGGELLPSSLPR